MAATQATPLEGILNNKNLETAVLIKSIIITSSSRLQLAIAAPTLTRNCQQPHPSWSWTKTAMVKHQQPYKEMHMDSHSQGTVFTQGKVITFSMISLSISRTRTTIHLLRIYEIVPYGQAKAIWISKIFRNKKSELKLVTLEKQLWRRPITSTKEATTNYRIHPTLRYLNILLSRANRRYRTIPIKKMSSPVVTIAPPRIRLKELQVADRPILRSGKAACSLRTMDISRNRRFLKAYWSKPKITTGHKWA